MSQKAFLQKLDSICSAAFVAVGPADAAVWRARRGTAVADCTVYIDRDVALSTEGDGGVTYSVTTITVHTADLPRAAEEGDTFTIPETNEQFEVSRALTSDESRTVCQVKD